MTDQSPALTLLHLSDLHFGQARGDGFVHFDQRKVIAELVKDAAKMRETLGAPDAIVVTGDVAFSASPEQYRQADDWLRELVRAVAVSPEKVWLVPGNHDVDRGQATMSKIRKSVHSDLRGSPHKLDEYFLPDSLEDFESSLWPKLQPYSEFARPWAAPTLSPAHPFWKQELTTPLGKLTLLGLNSCLLSLDNTDKKENLALSKAQLHRLFENLPEQSLALALMHHPPDWLSDGEELLKELQKYPHILFTGHVHTPEVSILHGSGQNARLQLAAGAAHADPKQPGQHSYAWIRLSPSGLEWHPRTYSERWNAFRADHDRLEESKTSQKFEPNVLPKKLREWLELPPPILEGTAPALIPSSPGRDVFARSTWQKPLQYFQSRHAYIELQGIRRTDGAFRIPLEQVYVELRAGDAGKTTLLRFVTRVLASRKDKTTFSVNPLEQTVGLHQALAKSSRAIFIGDPGSGKTTLLRFVTRVLAEGSLLDGAPTSRARQLLALTDQQPLPYPLFTTLADLDHWLSERDIPLRAVTGSLARGFLCSVLEQAGLPLTLKELEALINAQRLIVLLDGFDEIPGHRQRQRAAKAVAELLATCPQLRVLMTSRTRAFETDVQGVLAQLEPWRLQPMSQEELRRFLHVWFRAVHTPNLAQGEKVAQELFDELQHHTEVKEMATTPNIVTLMAILKHNHAHLPKRRVELYREVIDLFLQLKDNANGLEDCWEPALGIRLELSEKRLLLSKLALEMHAGGEAGRTVPMKVPVMCLAKQLLVGRSLPDESSALAKAERLLDVLELRSGLLRKEGYGVQFSHLGLQEYLTAFALSRQGESELWGFLEPRLKEDWWNEVIRLLVALKENQSGPLLRSLANAGQGKAPDWEKAGRGIALALGGLGDLPALHVSKPDEQAMRSKLDLLVGKETPLPVASRIEALLALGRVGDPRLGMDNPQRWVWHEPGSFLMGSEDGNSDERPVHRVTFRHGFWLGKYPVTNQEYAAFVKAKGYQTQAWWSTKGWEYIQQEKRVTPELWNAPSFNAPNQPVVGVSWYEAQAFCRWQNHTWKQTPPTQLLEALQLSGDKTLTIRLPSEAEWEYAARGAQSFKYPWGNTPEPEPERANFGVQVGCPTPVGAYPLGQSWAGAADLAGNVWERCQDAWHDSYTGAPDDGTVRRIGRFNHVMVIRGGFRYDDPFRLRDLRGANRSLTENSPGLVKLVGLRVVLVPVPAAESR